MPINRRSFVFAVCLLATPSIAVADSGPLSLITTFQGNPALSNADVVHDALDGGGFHPTENWLAVSDNSTKTRLFDLSTEPPTVVFTVTHDAGYKYGNPATHRSDKDGETNTVSFTPDGNWMLSGINDKGIKIWNAHTGAFSQQVDNGASVDGAAFGSDGQYVAVGAQSVLRVYEFDTSTGKAGTKVLDYNYGSGEINSIDFSDDGNYLVAVGGGGSGAIRIFRTSNWSLKSTYYNKAKSGSISVKSVMFSPDSQLVAYGARQDRARILDLNGNLLKILKHASKSKYYKYDDNDRSAANESLDWTPDSKYLITGGLTDGIARVWRRRDWSLVGWVRGQDPGPDVLKKRRRGRAIESVRIDSQKRVSLAGDEGRVHLYQFNTPTEKGAFEPKSNLVSIEAENFDTNLGQGFVTGTTNHQEWAPMPHAGASGGAGLTVADAGMTRDTNYQSYDPTADAPKLDYIVNFSRAGTYYLWVRGMGPNKGNSIHVGLDGQMVDSGEKIQFGDTGSADWIWSKLNRAGRAAKLVIDEAGEHTLNLWMREDGVSIDKLIISADPSLDPSTINDGLGPVETARATSPPKPNAVVSGGQK